MKNKLFGGAFLCSILALTACGGGTTVEGLGHDTLDQYLFGVADAESLIVDTSGDYNVLRRDDGDQITHVLYQYFEESENDVLNIDHLTSFKIDGQHFIEFKLLSGFDYKITNREGATIKENVVDNAEDDYNSKDGFIMYNVPEAGRYSLEYTGKYVKKTYGPDQFNGEIDRIYEFDDHYVIVNYVDKGTSQRKNAEDLAAYDRGQYFTGAGSSAYVLNLSNGVATKMEGYVISDINEQGQVHIGDDYFDVSFDEQFNIVFSQELE